MSTSCGNSDGRVRERFAPSPTGFLHAGHAYSALTAWTAAKDGDGEFRLRIEDIDQQRCRTEFEAAIFEDLTWLGITWTCPVLRQSDRLGAYDHALQRLIALGLCYPCRCTRKDIARALSAPQEGADTSILRERGRSPERERPIASPVYPGCCRHRSMSERTERDAVRLDLRRAINFVGGETGVSRLNYLEIGSRKPLRIRLSADELLTRTGDVVLARKDIGTSYNLAVVVDDAFQSVTHVTRGKDLTTVTPLHVLLQRLLGLSTPIYRHHRLIRDAQNIRLSKRRGSTSLRSLKAEGRTPEEVLSFLRSQ